MVKRMTRLAMLTALALALSWVERLIPAPVPVPGIKLGLANWVVVVALYRMGAKAALGVSLARVLLAGFLFGGFLPYALTGAICSFCVMAALRRTDAFSAVGVSAAGGAAHVSAQLLVAMAVAQTPGLIGYLPWLLVSGVVSGTLVGYLAQWTIDRVSSMLD